VRKSFRDLAIARPEYRPEETAVHNPRRFTLEVMREML
jgi:hypothetical protein